MSKFEFFLHLRELGIKDEHAVKMAKQALKNQRMIFQSTASAVLNFASWDDTDEGHTYWDKQHEKYASVVAVKAKP